MNNKLEEISKEIKKYGIRNNTIISTLPIGIIRPIKNETDGSLPIDILNQRNGNKFPPIPENDFNKIKSSEEENNFDFER